VLVAGDLADATSMSALLACLPEHAYGQVYVEVPAGTEAVELAAPARVSVNLLTRDPDAEPGRLLAAAVSGWVGEWVPEEPDPARAVTLWVGATVRDRVDPLGAPLQLL
jgi:NADPH-dependent ferric siderophore reductase